MIELPKMTFCKILPDLPKPSKLRRQIRKDGGYNMVPAYTDEEMFKYGEVCAAEAREKMREECIALIGNCPSLRLTQFAWLRKAIKEIP